MLCEGAPVGSGRAAAVEAELHSASWPAEFAAIARKRVGAGGGEREGGGGERGSGWDGAERGGGGRGGRGGGGESRFLFP